MVDLRRDVRSPGLYVSKVGGGIKKILSEDSMTASKAYEAGKAYGIRIGMAIGVSVGFGSVTLITILVKLTGG